MDNASSTIGRHACTDISLSRIIENNNYFLSQCRVGPKGMTAKYGSWPFGNHNNMLRSTEGKL